MTDDLTIERSTRPLLGDDDGEDSDEKTVGNGDRKKTVFRVTLSFKGAVAFILLPVLLLYCLSEWIRTPTRLSLAGADYVGTRPECPDAAAVTAHAPHKSEPSTLSDDAVWWLTRVRYLEESEHDRRDGSARLALGAGERPEHYTFRSGLRFVNIQSKRPVEGSG